MEQGLMTRFSKKVMDAVWKAIVNCTDIEEELHLWTVYANYNARYCYYYYERHNL